MLSCGDEFQTNLTLVEGATGKFLKTHVLNYYYVPVDYDRLNFSAIERFKRLHVWLKNVCFQISNIFARKYDARKTRTYDPRGQTGKHQFTRDASRVT